MLWVGILPSEPSCPPGVGHGLWGVFPFLVVLVVGMVTTGGLPRVLTVALLLMMTRMMI